MEWKVTTAPASEPVTLAEAKLYLRVDSSADDDLITELIKTARQWCEGYQNRAYIQQTITAYRDAFASQMPLPMPPLVSVTTIKYYDTAGVQQTLDSGYYDVDTTTEPGRIILGHSDSWPTVRGHHHDIEIIYLAGYGDETTDVPEYVKSAMKFLIGHLYEHREMVSELTLKEVPFAVKSLLSIDRIVPV